MYTASDLHLSLNHNSFMYIVDSILDATKQELEFNKLSDSIIRCNEIGYTVVTLDGEEKSLIRHSQIVIDKDVSGRIVGECIDLGCLQEHYRIYQPEGAEFKRNILHVVLGEPFYISQNDILNKYACLRKNFEISGKREHKKYGCVIKIKEVQDV